MKLQLLILLLFVSGICYSQNYEFKESELAYINKVIALFKQKNIHEISKIIHFPLRREYPIPNIKDRNEFIRRFDHIFDKNLINQIATAKVAQCSDGGWRGIMLDNGVLWIGRYDGKIIAVNYQSDFERNLKKSLIAKEKENVHSSLKTFERPTYRIKTKSYFIRIDELPNFKYRYASWKAGKKESAKPDIILNNGELIFEGSGGNHVITFSSKNYTYKIYRNLVGAASDPDLRLVVETDERIVLAQDGTLIGK